MTQLPNYQVTANPISNFETFGEAAPSAPATIEGMPAAPIDTYTPTMRLLGQLSNTLTNFLQDEKVRENEIALEQGEASTMANEMKILEEARKGNMLKYASMVDKGLVTDNENPWFSVGAKRALASMNARMIRNNRNETLSSDFLNNVDSLSSSSDPLISVAGYMSQRSNPLGLSEDILQDHYYMVNFEKQFSKLRQETTDEVIKMRNNKARGDMIDSIAAEVDSFFEARKVNLRTVEKFMGPTAAEFFSERLDEISNNKEFIDTLGPEAVGTAVNMFLIERAGSGDMNAMLILEQRNIKDADLRVKANDLLGQFEADETKYNAEMAEEAEERATEIAISQSLAGIADAFIEGESVSDATLRVVSDPNLRAALGNQTVIDNIGAYAIKLGVEGNSGYLEILNTKLPNGMTVLQSSDATKAEYALKINDIKRSLKETFSFNSKQANNNTKNSADAALQNIFEASPETTDKEVFMRFREASNGQGSIFNYKDSTDTLQITQVYADGTKYSIDIDTSKHRAAALKNRHQTRVIQQARGLINDPIQAQGVLEGNLNSEKGLLPKILVAAASESYVRDDYVDADIRNAISRGFKLVTGGRDINPEQFPDIENALMLYRAVSLSENKGLMSEYFSGKGEQETFYMLDILEKGNTLPGMSDLPLGSGNLSGSLSLLTELGDIAAEPIDSSLYKDYKESLEEQLQSEGFDTITRQRLLMLGELRFKLGGQGTANEAASDIINNFAVSGNNYSYLTTDVRINSDEAPALFDGIINDLRRSTGERREELLKSPISAKVNEFLIEQTEGKDNTDEEYLEMLNSIKFVGKQDGSFIITAGPRHESLERFSLSLFKEDLRNRASLPKIGGKRAPRGIQNPLLNPKINDSVTQPSVEQPKNRGLGRGLNRYADDPTLNIDGTRK